MFLFVIASLLAAAGCYCHAGLLAVAAVTVIASLLGRVGLLLSLRACPNAPLSKQSHSGFHQINLFRQGCPLLRVAASQSISQ